VNPADFRILSMTTGFEHHKYRTPIKFGGQTVSEVKLINVTCRACTPGGAVRGFGSMPLGNVWSFPSKHFDNEGTLSAMEFLTEAIQGIYQDCKLWGHPIDFTWTLEPEFFKAADRLARSWGRPEPIPRLCTFVCASAFDAALHDAYGKAHRLNCYQTYGPDFLKHDLGRYLGAAFAGEELQRYVARRPQPRMPLYHLVGALDPITDADITRPVGDGLPETLPQWIRLNGLTHLKIKLNGDDLAWDVDRVLRVDRVAAETQCERGSVAWRYSLDVNERCANVAYLLEFLAKVRERAPEGFERVAYVEQPTARDLSANRDNLMHAAAKIKPVVIDESLLDLESLLLAREMGYTGVALKACKGQTQSLLLGAAAQKYGMFLCVQDLTCPGASLIHSAGLAAHIPGVTAIEANARQYVPAANRGWEDRFPGIFRVTDGTMETGCLTGRGLGAVAD
jgi:L-alanine-DL-glutamate epimerase-like enolase superfamily enzyme